MAVLRAGTGSDGRGRPRGTLVLTLRLARRFLRSRRLAATTVVVGLAALSAVAMYVALSSLSLTAQQIADRDLGRFGATAGYGLVRLAPGSDEPAVMLRDAAVAAGADDATVVLVATDLEMASQSMGITLLETDWRAAPFPARFRLLAGRWPESAGEVVLADGRG